MMMNDEYDDDAVAVALAGVMVAAWARVDKDGSRRRQEWFNSSWFRSSSRGRMCHWFRRWTTGQHRVRCCGCGTLPFQEHATNYDVVNEKYVIEPGSERGGCICKLRYETSIH